jgi:hypothetical protein
MMARTLRQDEREIIRALLSSSPSRIRLASGLEEALVEDMADGGMGSIRFVRSHGDRAKMGMEFASADYLDADSVSVSITLNLDEEGQLFELDFWKVDFSPLMRYPRADELRMKPRPSTN